MRQREAKEGAMKVNSKWSDVGKYTRRKLGIVGKKGLNPEERLEKVPKQKSGSVKNVGPHTRQQISTCY